jgi:hypothetical protein
MLVDPGITLRLRLETAKSLKESSGGALIYLAAVHLLEPRGEMTFLYSSPALKGSYIWRVLVVILSSMFVARSFTRLARKDLCPGRR